jgi:hypothetical protein
MYTYMQVPWSRSLTIRCVCNWWKRHFSLWFGRLSLDARACLVTHGSDTLFKHLRVSHAVGRSWYIDIVRALSFSYDSTVIARITSQILHCGYQVWPIRSHPQSWETWSQTGKFAIGEDLMRSVVNSRVGVLRCLGFRHVSFFIVLYYECRKVRSRIFRLCFVVMVYTLQTEIISIFMILCNSQWAASIQDPLRVTTGGSVQSETSHRCCIEFTWICTVIHLLHIVLSRSPTILCFSSARWVASPFLF